VIPEIMASQAYKDNGVIVIWTDETEGTNQNDFTHTLAFIVISKLAKGNAYASAKDYTHSSDLATLQKVFGLRANTPSGYLNDAANAQLDGTTDISDMFKPGVIPKSLPKY
jgi:phosphatidylinositol-3-phosphatase